MDDCYAVVLSEEQRCRTLVDVPGGIKLSGFREAGLVFYFQYRYHVLRVFVM
jgi:hypothetical protein